MTLANIKFHASNDYLEGMETGAIRRLQGFDSKRHAVPVAVTNAANAWVQRLLTARIDEEIQKIYLSAKGAMKLRRSDMRKDLRDGSADLSTPAFHYFIEAMQSPNDAAEYSILRRLSLRENWEQFRDQIGQIFRDEFDLVVVEFDAGSITFDDLVARLEDVTDRAGGTVQDDDRYGRVSYVGSAGASIVFDLPKRRLEMAFGIRGCLGLIDAARAYCFDVSGGSPLLVSASRGAGSR
jgi:hypothetical protein